MVVDRSVRPNAIVVLETWFPSSPHKSVAYSD